MTPFKKEILKIFQYKKYYIQDEFRKKNIYWASFFKSPNFQETINFDVKSKN